MHAVAKRKMVSYSSDFKAESITRSKEWYFIITKNSIYQKIILHFFALINSKVALKHMKKNLQIYEEKLTIYSDNERF